MGNSSSSNDNEKWNRKSTSLQVVKEFGNIAKDKYIIVTGGNSGLGFETSRALAEYGAHVVIACRQSKLGQEAVDKIKAQHPDADVSTMSLDLASLASVDQFVSQYKMTSKPLNILINNAGIMACPKRFTKDGIEMQFGVNHIGHFSLTMQLIDLLQQSSTPQSPSRIVNLSSLANYVFTPRQGVDFSDIKAEKGYDPFGHYGISKLANILFTRELHRRYSNSPQHPILSMSLHPGSITATNLGQHLQGAGGLSGMWSMLSSSWTNSTFRNLAGEVSRMKSTEEGCATTLYCALAPDVTSGEYYADCQIEREFIYQAPNIEDLTKQLWQVSCEITGQGK